MALSLTTQWMLVASGLVAHADHVLSGEECERLMALVDEEVDGDAYAQWMSIVSDRERLDTMLEGLSPPPPESHRQILEDAWMMAVVDGERVDAELEALQRIATRLKVEPMQLEFWREAWSTSQHAYADTAVAALGLVLGGGGPALPEDDGVIQRFVHGLPTTHEHRAKLTSVGLVPQDGDEVQRRLAALTRTQRRDLVRRLAAATVGAAREGDARERWRTLGKELGIGKDELDRLADA
jgi:hypothetical protein